jgi:hypothetical protein
MSKVITLSYKDQATGKHCSLISLPEFVECYYNYILTSFFI